MRGISRDHSPFHHAAVSCQVIAEVFIDRIVAAGLPAMAREERVNDRAGAGLRSRLWRNGDLRFIMQRGIGTRGRSDESHFALTSDRSRRSIKTARTQR